VTRLPVLDASNSARQSGCVLVGLVAGEWVLMGVGYQHLINTATG